MAQIIIDIPDAALTRVRDAFAAEFGWNADLGVTKAQFAKAQLAEYVKQIVRNYEGNLAAGTARKASDDTINAIAIT